MKAVFLLSLIVLCFSGAFADSSWIDLSGPGHAVGPAQTRSIKNPDGTITNQYGSLQDGVLLPESGDGFIRVNSAETGWGAGMMISLLKNASAFYVEHFSPNYKVHIASIALEHGGPYGPHKSHQNGLDGDVYFMGQTKYESVLDENGMVTEKFNPQKNWDFWRILVSQQIDVNGKSPPAVYMIFIHPTLKTYLCEWAKAQGLLGNPLDREILRRLWPTVGHDTHFHLRLRCSPFYKDCIQQNEIADVTGCGD
ncbi:penicillin-insensitive murein endopeptidase [Bdellovibrio sp. SKB1291214]|uniref:penicillin-insensitive murein endopeptidase n=1 Tax=Bdellovibrio sp. SKB1291214 TaxID=1732569 RepID=UPI001C3CD01A|nr:penicillin-insensitive murein endopeptidase [Bdellovibrio sp. SKB1291214]UYL09389.1 penicillin-insensitive murein endopeptidase [Bdellovibrio sp. SKB1291214]